jgi:hypothetical protein
MLNLFQSCTNAYPTALGERAASLFGFLPDLDASANKPRNSTRAAAKMQDLHWSESGGGLQAAIKTFGCFIAIKSDLNAATRENLTRSTA